MLRTQFHNTCRFLKSKVFRKLQLVHFLHVISLFLPPIFCAELHGIRTKTNAYFTLGIRCKNGIFVSFSIRKEIIVQVSRNFSSFSLRYSLQRRTNLKSKKHSTLKHPNSLEGKKFAEGPTEIEHFVMKRFLWCYRVGESNKFRDIPKKLAIFLKH